MFISGSRIDGITIKKNEIEINQWINNNLDKIVIDVKPFKKDFLILWTIGMVRKLK